MAILSPPANLDELSPNLREAWSGLLLNIFDRVSRSESLQQGRRYYHLGERPAQADDATAEIPWNGFPRKFDVAFPANPARQYRFAEELTARDFLGRGSNFGTSRDGALQRLPFRDQDEYCEWRTQSDPASGQLQRVVFTCENPEYWNFIAHNDETLLLTLYRDLVGPQVQRDDLFFGPDHVSIGRDGRTRPVAGRYNPLNRWNTTHGIVHLTHPANSLFAEIALAADATILYRDGDGDPVEEDSALICCAGFGGPNRASDPTIGGGVNSLVRNGLAVTIDDPVGLYIFDIDLQGVEVPGGGDPRTFFHVIRGDETRKQILRAEFAPPAGSGLTLDDVLVDGEPLRYGGQLAKLVTMVIYGRGFRAAGAPPLDAECRAKCCTIPSAPALRQIQRIDLPCPGGVPGLVATPGDEADPEAVAADFADAGGEIPEELDHYEFFS